MRLMIELKRKRKGYTVRTQQGIRIGLVDSLNVINAYKSRHKGRDVLVGMVFPYHISDEVYQGNREQYINDLRRRI